MKLNNVKLLFLSLFILSIAACNKNSVKLIDKNFEEEVATTGSLDFIFDKDVVSDSILNYWIMDDLIEFTPKIEGRFAWHSNSVLTFSPYYELPPATHYTAKLTNKIVESTVFKLRGETEIKFHTPDIQIVNALSYWHLPEGSDKPVLRLELNFNYALLTKKIAESIVVEVADKKVDFNLASAEISDQVVLDLLNVQKQDNDLEGKLTIKSGFEFSKFNTRAEHEIKSDFIVPNPFVMDVQDVQFEHNGSEGIVRVYTTQAVVNNNLSSYIKVDPSLSFKTHNENGYFEIRSSAFQPKEVYELTLVKGLKGVMGGTLKNDYVQDISFGELPPDITILNDKAIYVPAASSKNIEVEIINVPKVRVRIAKIYENNLLSYYNYGYSMPYFQGEGNEDEEYYDSEDYYYDDYGYDDSEFGDIIYDEVIETAKLTKKGNLSLLNLDVKDKLKDFNGMYYIQIASAKDYWIKDSRLISITDIGLISKVGQNKITVFANSIKSASPLSNVIVYAYGKNNQLIGKTTTDGNGTGEIELINKEMSGFNPALIIAKTANDFTSLNLRRTEVNTSRFDVGGKRTNKSNVDAYLYFERNIYRPGETVNGACILRDFNFEKIPNAPFTVSIVLPSGKELKSLKKYINDQASFDFSFPIPKSVMTGTYSLVVKNGAEVVLAHQNVLIEEFMPDRIKLTTRFDKSEYAPKDKVNLELTAINYFGPPAANRNYEAELQLSALSYHSKKYNDYNFRLENLSAYFQPINFDGTTDANGKANATYEIPASYTNMGILELEALTTVFDETGRPVNRNQKVNIYTQTHFNGIGYFPRYVRLNEQMKIPLIAVDKNDNPQAVSARVEFYKNEYKTILEKSGSYYSYRSQKTEKKVGSQSINIAAGGTHAVFAPKEAGSYMIRVFIPGSSRYVESDFYAYGWGSGSNNNFEVDNEGNIDIELDKKSYLVGDNAKVLLKAPFNGKILITVENKDVIDKFYVDCKERSASFDIRLPKNYVPNVYITATLFKEHINSDNPLTVAHGFMNLKVENPAAQMPVSIEAVENSRSNAKQKIVVNAFPESYVTIAAVDEGILAMSNFKTPDPYSYFYGKQALEVSSHDVYPYLFPVINGKSTGGDGMGSDMDLRSNPIDANRVKLVAFWSGLVKTNSNGKAEMEINIPQFSGDIRIMAVAHKDDAFGSDEHHIKVADPIVISPAIPRVMAPGDTLDMPVSLSNTTKNSQNVKVKLSTNGMLKIIEGSDQNLKLAANEEQFAYFKLYAPEQTGVANIKLNIEAAGEKFTNETELSIRPIAGLLKKNGSGLINTSSPATVKFGTDNMIPGTVKRSLICGSNPLINYAKDLDYLVTYPYGCAEQSISAAFPQLYYADLSNAFRQNNPKLVKASHEYVQEAMNKINLQLIYNGGLTTWPNGGYENWWTTAYAAHFLIEAKKAGFDINQSSLNKMLSYLQTKLRTKELVTYYYNGSENKKYAAREVAYSLYVLSLAGKPDLASLNYYTNKKDELTTDSKYLLAAAVYLSGNKRNYTELLPPSFGSQDALSSLSSNFSSPIRDRAIALNALVEIDPQNAQVGKLSKELSDRMNHAPYLNTQERAWAFLAMGKIAKSNKENNVSAKISANGKRIGQTEGNSLLTLIADQINGNEVSITTNGKGTLYYFWESQGVAANNTYVQEDNYLIARRTFYNRYGRQITNNEFEQNDLIVVKLSIYTTDNSTVNDVVITDILPAGFEIENPRLNDIPGTSWVSDESSPEYLDVRDDRVNMFVTATGKTRNYYYVVRAVSTGTFNLGPVTADAMYNGEFHSVNGGGKIKIVRKK